MQVTKSDCIACGMCVEACMVGAISIEPAASGYGTASIDPDKCIDCGVCAENCPGDAIK